MIPVKTRKKEMISMMINDGDGDGDKDDDNEDK